MGPPLRSAVLECRALNSPAASVSSDLGIHSGRTQDVQKNKSLLRVFFFLRSKSSNAEALQREKQTKACNDAIQVATELQAPRSGTELATDDDSKERLVVTAAPVAKVEKPDLWLMAYDRANLDEKQ